MKQIGPGFLSYDRTNKQTDTITEITTFYIYRLPNIPPTHPYFNIVHFKWNYVTILRSRKSSIFHFIFKSQEWRKQNCLFCLSIPFQKKRAVFENVKYFILNDFNFSIIPLHPKNVSPSLGIKYNYPPPWGYILCMCDEQFYFLENLNLNIARIKFE